MNAPREKNRRRKDAKKEKAPVAPRKKNGASFRGLQTRSKREGKKKKRAFFRGKGRKGANSARQKTNLSAGGKIQKENLKDDLSGKKETINSPRQEKTRPGREEGK